MLLNGMKSDDRLSNRCEGNEIQAFFVEIEMRSPNDDGGLLISQATINR